LARESRRPSPGVGSRTRTPVADARHRVQPAAKRSNTFGCSDEPGTASNKVLGVKIQGSVLAAVVHPFKQHTVLQALADGAHVVLDLMRADSSSVVSSSDGMRLLVCPRACGTRSVSNPNLRRQGAGQRSVDSLSCISDQSSVQPRTARPVVQTLGRAAQAGSSCQQADRPSDEARRERHGPVRTDAARRVEAMRTERPA
jgi:hypothetical protein